VIAAALLAVAPSLSGLMTWDVAIYRALTLLIIACPCALVISTPVTIVSGLTAAARRGVLVKGGVFLENGRKLRWLALDKTGTLTHGKPVCTDRQSFDDTSGDALQRMASLAARSDHPVSRALAAVADTVRDSSRAAIADLHTLGVRTLMLSGDTSQSAQAVARDVGVSEVHGGLMPQDKLAWIESRLGNDGWVGMVGDGINDAPALARQRRLCHGSSRYGYGHRYGRRSADG